MSAAALCVLLLAHGGDRAWNSEARAVARQVSEKLPVELALGMADSAAMQKGISALEGRGCRKIAAVPLFVNSRSEVLAETRYLLGLEKEPSGVFRDAMAGHHHGHGHAPVNQARVRGKIHLVMAPALDDSALVAEILLERALALSRDPSGETVVLVGHGPVDPQAAGFWESAMASLSTSVRARGKFRAAFGMTLKDDAPKAVRDEAVAALRRSIREASTSSRVIVVPYLIARGGIEKKIPADLKGLSYAWDGRTICPHPNIAKWVLQSAESAARSGDMRRFQ